MEEYVKKNYERAVDDFKKAHEIDREPTDMFNIARCYELLQQFDKAILYYQDFLKMNPVKEYKNKAEAMLKKALSKILETMSELSMDTMPQGADVQIKDMNNIVIVNEKSPFRKYLKFGNYNLEIAEKGFEPLKKEITMLPGKGTLVSIELKKEVKIAVPAPVQPEKPKIPAVKPPEKKKDIPVSVSKPSMEKPAAWTSYSRWIAGGGALFHS